MEFKGTKGKWILDGVDGELFMISSDINDKGNVICQMPDKVVCEESLVHWKANAQLISKAPEMLEWMIKKYDKLNSIELNINSEAYEYYSELKELIKQATE